MDAGGYETRSTQTFLLLRLPHMIDETLLIRVGICVVQTKVMGQGPVVTVVTVLGHQV